MTEPKSQLPFADPELWALVEALVAGTAAPAERDRLNERLNSDSAAQLFYVAYLDMHAQLQWRMRGAAVPALSDKLARPDPGRTAPLAPSAGGPGRWSAPSRFVLAASLTLVVGLLATYWVPRRGSEEAESPDLPNAPEGSVAVLIGDRNARWEVDMGLPTQTGTALSPGRIKLSEGVIEVAFHGGAEVMLEGPAVFDVSDRDSGYLHKGKLTAKVAEGGTALHVGMPGVLVTEGGGECGMVTDDLGHTEVHVFRGQVGADPINVRGEPLPGLQLAENSGAHVDASRQTITPVPLDQNTFEHLRPEIRIIDASVRGGQFSNRNFGTAPQLVVKNSIPDYCWESFLRFDLSGIKGQVHEARVRLVPTYVGQPFANAAALVADNQWGETALTWDLKPPSGPPIAMWTVRAGEPVEFDVSALVQAALAKDKNLSLRLYAPNYERAKSYVQYGSRKGDADSRPQLLLTPVP